MGAADLSGTSEQTCSLDLRHQRSSEHVIQGPWIISRLAQLTHSSVKKTDRGDTALNTIAPNRPLQTTKPQAYNLWDLWDNFS